jgi:hypothetical protein
MERVQELVMQVAQDEQGLWECSQPIEDIQLLAPIPFPRTIRDFYAFEQHVETARGLRGLGVPKEWYEIPVFYFSNPYATTGPQDPLVIPPLTQPGMANPAAGAKRNDRQNVNMRIGRSPTAKPRERRQMSVFSALSNLTAELRLAREEARTRRIVNSLPIEIQKDIGWPDTYTEGTVAHSHRETRSK